MCCGYNPNKFLINKFTHDIGKVLDSFIDNYGNFLIVGDLNSEIGESSMHDFCNSYNLNSYVINLPVIKILKNHHALIFF